MNKNGRPYGDVLKELQKNHDQDFNWKDGKTFSLVYHAGDEHTEFLKQAYATYFHQNGLNPGAFPSLKKYEAEVIKTASNLLGGGPGSDVCGTMTSGGSESIMMAVKSYRDEARVKRPEILHPEMILPTTSHPAFDKAAHYFGVKPIWVPVDENFKVDLHAVKNAINSNTILLVGAAPQYPHGVIDPIEKLAEIALEHKIGLHVDACVGGFILPFLKKCGEKIPPFDFSIKGVTSMSADLHKYGFAAKGASLVLYHTKELRRFQFFVSTEWPGGAFASPSMTGTRPAGSIAAAWATLESLGEEGYIRITKQILENVKKFQTGIVDAGFKIIGKPEATIFGFTHESVDIFAIGDQMEKKGWHIDKQQKPNCLHLMITPAHTPIISQFIADLKESLSIVQKNPELSQTGAAALYGMVAHIPDRSQISGFLLQYMDGRYE